MDECIRCEAYVRERITELRMRKNVSEHRMSLELGKSGSYIRGITSGTALPSLRELFNIIAYFDMSPSEFFLRTRRSIFSSDFIEGAFTGTWGRGSGESLYLPGLDSEVMRSVVIFCLK